MTVIYNKTKKEFFSDLDSLQTPIEDLIESLVYKIMRRKSSWNEKNSWKCSLVEIGRVIKTDEIPDDARVSIEYNIPSTGMRVDFIISGEDNDGNLNSVIIELKQWGDVKISEMDGHVETWVAKAMREERHPSYQARSYAYLLENYSAFVENEPVNLIPCAFLHNYEKRDNKIDNGFYKEYISKAPIFLKNEKQSLREFIKKYICKGDSRDIINSIDTGEIRPSKKLANEVKSMITGNSEFVLIDEQKTVYEKIKKIARAAQLGNKKVIIVKGGPGTGKSVIAIQVLGALMSEGITTEFVSKTSAVRGVYSAKLSGTHKKKEIEFLFKSSGKFTSAKPDEYGCLLTDEAHRLNEKSGIFSNYGENQVKEIINASKCSVFFIDEDQRVHLKDIGTVEEIEKWAKLFNADVETMELLSQFRCGGSNGYLSWLDNTLGIRETANIFLEGIKYDFKVFDSPNKLREAILLKNQKYEARIVAGYCRPWIKEGKNNTNVYDIIIPDSPESFKMSWNLGNTSTYAIDETSINEVGCIHTVQGLEFDYVGVIIGDDFVIRNGIICTHPEKRAKTDQSIKGWKSMFKKNKNETLELLDLIIKNTYRVLMTRGQKGCYIYCTDPETREYFKDRIKLNN